MVKRVEETERDVANEFDEFEKNCIEQMMRDPLSAIIKRKEEYKFSEEESKSLHLSTGPKILIVDDNYFNIEVLH